MDTGTKIRINSLKFENVKFTYDESNWVLDDINFEVLKGQKIAIVGPSGGENQH